MNETRLSANFCRFPASDAISGNTDCVDVPLSEKVQPPIEMKTFRFPLFDFREWISAVCVNKSSGVFESIGLILYVAGSMYANAKFT